MAHPPQPPQLAQPPFHPQQPPPKKKHEVMANIMCNTGALAAGQVEAMNCISNGTYTKKFDKVTAEAAF